MLGHEWLMSVARRTLRLGGLAAMSLLLAPALAGCGGDDDSEEPEEECQVDATYDPAVDPGTFAAAVDNPFFPLVPGTSFSYSAGAETVQVVVLPDTKVILGVTCIIVHDIASMNGEVIEDTYDWYAQDTSGNVWYFGEDTKELSGGEVVSTEGSWEAGVDGAKPGILIPAMPEIGKPYRQEYAACEAEDMGEVLATDATATVPFGTYTGCLQTHDYSPLEPEVNENKYYCPGVGLVLSVDVATGEREELTDVQGP